MRPSFGSLFSGIGGFDLGLERAGWECKWEVEIDEFRQRILARHWPDVPRWGDVRDLTFTSETGEQQLGPVDLICGGFPCQDLSVAGKRAGLQGERSGLFFEFARVAARLQPRWLLVENVPGLLSSHEGQDMGVVLETLSELGYGLAWRVLDSQHFGVPQRRRRVYIVGHLGALCPPEILFELEGGGGDSQAGQKTGQEVACAPRTSPNVAQPLRANRWGGSDSHGDEGNVVSPPPDADGVREAPGVPGWVDPDARTPDGRRYAALGDAVTVKVVEWIGRRMLERA